jgi:hypothetical protein
MVGDLDIAELSLDVEEPGPVGQKLAPCEHGFLPGLDGRSALLCSVFAGFDTEQSWPARPKARYY